MLGNPGPRRSLFHLLASALIAARLFFGLHEGAPPTEILEDIVELVEPLTERRRKR